MNIMFVMEPRGEAGSIQAVSNYVKEARKLGHTLAVYGNHGHLYPGVPLSTDCAAFDRVFFVFESNLLWMTNLRLVPFLARVPRAKRIVLDADGLYNDLVTVDGYDRNHPSKESLAQWRCFLEELSDRIFQPALGVPRNPLAEALPFYGYPPGQVARTGAPENKRYDVIYVGHNWWRWRDIGRLVLPAIEKIRSRLGRIAFVGLYWEGPPPGTRGTEVEQAFFVDSNELSRLGIEVMAPVPFNQVIDTMSQSRISIMIQRPLLRLLGHLTSKYFEVFCADTVPLLLLDEAHAGEVYGPFGRELVFSDRLHERILDVLATPEKYDRIVREIRNHLTRCHSYRNRLEELVRALDY